MVDDDDDADVTSTFKMILEMNGFEVEMHIQVLYLHYRIQDEVILRFNRGTTLKILP